MNKFIFLVCTVVFVFAFIAHGECCSITYGVYSDYKPYEWVDDKGFHGINIDLMNAVSKRTGCVINYVSYSWFEMVDKLKQGKIDVVSSSINNDTLSYAVPLPTIFVQYRLVVGTDKGTRIQNINDLNNKKILIVKENIEYATLNKKGIKPYFIFKKSEKEVLKALAVGEADLGIIDNSAYYLLDKYPNLKILSDPLFPTLYGFIVKPDSHLYSLLLTTIESMKKSGEYYKIVNVPDKKRHELILYLACIIVVLGFFVFILVMLWNKSLYLQVNKKTKRLNDEIEKHIQTEKMLNDKTIENNNNITLLQKVLNAIPETIFVVDKHLNILWQSNLKDNDCSFDLIKNDVKNVLADFNDRGSFTVEDGDNDIWKVLVIELTYLSDEAFLIVVGNITENIRLRDELFMTTRYSALGEMSAIIAHEINTPLGSVMHNMDFFAGILEGLVHKEDVEDIKSAEKSVNKSLEKIKTIVDELKKYTNKQSKDFGKVDLTECCKSAVSITRFLINKKTSNFIMDIDEKPIYIYGNVGYVEQMIINILQNACYAIISKDRKIILKLDRKDDKATVSVTDQGIGMSEDVLKKACLPYFTTRKDEGGTGLGLSLTARVMKEHNGTIHIESKEGYGTTVKLCFNIGDDL